MFFVVVIMLEEPVPSNLWRKSADIFISFLQLYKGASNPFCDEI